MDKTTDNFIMLPTVDFCFKELMQNPKVRQGFIAALLGLSADQIEGTEFLPTILRREKEEGKLGILDVRVLMADGSQIDMEMQVAHFEYWDKRILFYLGKMYTEQIYRGDSYEKLQKCIHVSILNFVHFPNDTECYRTIHLRDDKTGEVYTDLLELQILELSKLAGFVEEPAQGGEVIDWMRFFSGKERKEFEDMAKTNEYLDEAYHTLLNLSADEEKRLEYEAREKALKDYNTQMSSALKRGFRRGEEQGLAQGLEQGLAQGIELTKRVLRLADTGRSLEEIARDCEITVEQVQRILS